MIEKVWKPIVIVLAVVGLAHVIAAALAQPAPTSADFQSSYDGIIKQLSTDNVSVHAQLLADQRELAAVEKERDELKAKLAESTAVRGSTPPKQ